MDGASMAALRHVYRGDRKTAPPLSLCVELFGKKLRRAEPISLLRSQAESFR